MLAYHPTFASAEFSATTADEAKEPNNPYFDDLKGFCNWFLQLMVDRYERAVRRGLIQR